MENLRKIGALVALCIGCSGVQAQPLQTRELADGWSFRQLNIGTWSPAVVPGTVHEDLLSNGRIEDPYFRVNERSLQWIDKLDWEYRTVFDAPESVGRDRVELCFDGLDTYAAVYLNGECVLESANMFRRYRVDVTRIVRPAGNELRVVFSSPVREGLERLTAYGIALKANNDQSELGGLGPVKIAPFNRKAGYHFGWDWGPRLVTSGIWRPVRLESWGGARLADDYVYTLSCDERSARMGVDVTLEVAAAGTYRVDVLFDGERVARFDRMLGEGRNTLSSEFELRNPRLWWPNGAGDPNLYRVEVSLSRADTVIDRRTHRTGVRTLRLVQRDDADGRGRSFGFEVNGRMLFMKGANWIPSDNLLPRVTSERLGHLVRSARDAHMNMLRVWGGGTYEDDRFYALCDSCGILVWQDFMFACSNLPGDEPFLAEVRAEAEDNVVRLRNHPSIALWCGNNEIEILWRPWNATNKPGMKDGYPQEQADVLTRAYVGIFHELLPDVVRRLTRGAGYWHSSPSPGERIPWGSVDVTRYGDVHNWNVWHKRLPFEHYEEAVPRFASEYGFQSFPEMATVATYTLPEDREIESEVMTAHQRSKIGNSTILEYMARDYRVPTRFGDILYMSQVLQAEGVRRGIEAHRRGMPWCMGSLYWQINDCWPVASWSSIDCYGRWKALHYAAARAFENVIVSPFRHGDTLDLYVVSDLVRPVTGRLELTLLDFDGRELGSRTLRVKAGANTSTLVGSFPVSELLSGVDRTQCVLVCRLTGRDVDYETLYYFDKVKNLRLPSSDVHFAVRSGGEGRCVVELSTDRLAKSVAVAYNGETGIFSDNCFDLLPGRPREIELRTADAPETVLRGLTCMTIDKTYEMEK